MNENFRKRRRKARAVLMLSSATHEYIDDFTLWCYVCCSTPFKAAVVDLARSPYWGWRLYVGKVKTNPRISMVNALIEYTRE